MIDLKKGAASLLILAGLSVALTACSTTSSATGGDGDDEPCIRGRVLGPEGPLDDVRVTTEPPTDVRLTLEGVYKICEFVKTGQPLTDGTYKLTLFKAGWKPGYKEVKFEGDLLVVADIQLTSNDPNAPVIDESDVPTENKSTTTGPGRTVKDE